ncbi:PilN domain-containing protein [Acetobacter persici]|uniref:PilN domain-containing protein n=1 Tax=Acetobacter persici TaxID=1076596 RepID=UPI0039E76554
MNALTRSALITWWFEQNTTVLRKISSRYLPARLAHALHTIQTRYAIPTVVIAPATGNLTLLPQTPGEPPRHAPATPDGMTHLASLCANRQPALRAWRDRRQNSLSIRVVFPDLPILQRVIRLPAAVAGEAVSLISYQMDRVVPFPAEETVWGLTPLPSEHPAEAEFLLSVAPLAPLAPWLDAFKVAHLTPVCFANQTSHSTVSLPLAEHGLSKKTSGQTALLIALALGVVLSAPFIWQSVMEYRLAGQLEELQPSRLVADTLHNRIDALTSASTLLNREIQRVGSPLTLLSNLTKSLPDTTFLESLSLKQGQVTLEGQSKEAARLISLLEHDKTMRDPKFVGPLLRLPDGRGESFTLHGTVSN